MMPLETETIIHLAAINLNPQDSAFDEEYFRVNTELTAKLFRYFLNSNAKTTNKKKFSTRVFPSVPKYFFNYICFRLKFLIFNLITTRWV
jgi:hypothetical protein